MLRHQRETVRWGAGLSLKIDFYEGNNSCVLDSHAAVSSLPLDLCDNNGTFLGVAKHEGGSRSLT